jgi:uncharacterized membrane protein YkvA (DUF1232 family)
MIIEKREMKKHIVRKREERALGKGRMKNFLMFLPNMVRLCGGLLMDNRVPITEKALFGAAIVYAISPIDFIPDFFPFIGQIDDIYLIALTLLRLVNYTDEQVVRENWKGGGDIIPLASSIAQIAPKFLPQRISRVISSRVKLGSAGRIVESVKNDRGPILVEVPEKKIEVDAASKANN